MIAVTKVRDRVHEPSHGAAVTCHQWHSRTGITLGGNHTRIDGNRVDSINPPTGDSYSTKVFAYARYEPKSARYWMEYRVRHNGSAAVNADPNQPLPPVARTLPSFTVQGVGSGMCLFAGSGVGNDLTLRVENLTDRLYAEFLNATFFRPEPGRTAKLSYRVTF